MFLFNILNNTKHTRCWDTFWHLTSSYQTKQYWHILYNTHKSFLMHWRTWRRAGTPRPCWAMLGPALAPWPNWDRGHGVSLTLASYHCLRKSQISINKYGKVWQKNVTIRLHCPFSAWPCFWIIRTSNQWAQFCGPNCSTWRPDPAPRDCGRAILYTSRRCQVIHLWRLPK